MMQPVTTSGAVAKPNSSAPSSAPITTSRPVFIWPSTCTAMRPRRRFSTSVCCVSASPSSHGVPACLIDDPGDAPVPPSWPAIVTWSAFAFATPAATVPTPTSGDELHRDRAARIRVLEIVDQLREILDRVDVVMRRRRDQPDAGHRVAQLRDVLGDLVPGQLAALAGLRALRHLDLQLLGGREVLGGDAEAAEATCLIFDLSESPASSAKSPRRGRARARDASVSPCFDRRVFRA